MKKTTNLLVAFLLFLAITAFFVLELNEAFSDPATIVVPDDYPTIQQAVDAAQAGDTIFVRNGVYKERELAIEKSLTLIAESNGTVIDGEGSWGNVYFESVSGGVFQGFSITNGYGIYLHRSSGIEVRDNLIYGNEQGIVLLESSQNSLSRNVVVDGGAMSILLQNSSQNTVVENTVMFNRGNGVWLENSTSNIISDNIILRNGLNVSEGFHVYGICLSYSSGNEVYHNDIVENFEQASGWMSMNNAWDNGYPSGGNYWSYYTGEDANGDEIGDIPYVVNANNIDRYPLMKPMRYNLPLEPTRMLMLEVSGEHDYKDKEGIRIRITASVRDANTAGPVSNASVTIEINDPDGNPWIADVMTERTTDVGIYEWESNGTIHDLMQGDRLKPGVYVAHIKAWVDQGPVASDILQFHIDPPSENPDGFPPLNLDYFFNALIVIACGVIIAIGFSAWYRTWKRSAKIRRPLIRFG